MKYRVRRTPATKVGTQEFGNDGGEQLINEMNALIKDEFRWSGIAQDGHLQKVERYRELARYKVNSGGCPVPSMRNFGNKVWSFFGLKGGE